MHLPALTSYLQGLRENNNKAWFVMNKPAYDILRPEFIALVTDVINGLAKHDPKIAQVQPKKALFRIYRDIRFSNDKTPYKTFFSASIAEEGVKNSGPMYYLSINADGNLHLGAGCWSPDRDVLARIRKHVVDDHAGLSRIVKNKRFVATFGELSDEDKLARLPKGYDPATPGIERYADLLRLKSFVVQANIDLTKRANASATKDLAGTIVTTFSAATPLDNWLRAAVAIKG
jgi:uncharacterized protein (TIGR02453 family)